MSDFHKLTYTVLKIYFKKRGPRIVKYRNYKDFCNNDFKNDLVNNLLGKNIQENDFGNFKKSVLDVLQKHAPLKTKYVRRNQGNFVDKKLNKAFMTRTRLLNKYRNHRSEINKLAYNKQRNYCVSLVRKKKKHFFNNLDVSAITDQKKFWKTVKPNFSDKSMKNENIILVENEKLIKKDIDIAETFNAFFVNIVKDLGIDGPTHQKDDLPCDDIRECIETFKHHPSIIEINKVCSGNKFSFNVVDIEHIEKLIDKLDEKKGIQQGDIPTKIIKENCDIFKVFITNNVNNCIETSTFPQELKLADVKPIFKKDSRNDKENYRPISILPNISKIYERCLYEQLSNYFENIFSKFQCGFRKGFSAEHCLLAMVEKWKINLDKAGVCGALLTDLSKAFDCLSHDLLIAKLNAYGLDMFSLKLMRSYISSRKQRVKVNNSYSSWKDIKYGVPQGSILGPILFNIFLCDLFYFIPSTDIASYADDNTPYSVNKDTEHVLRDIKQYSELLLEWFKNNGMKANIDKYHLLISDKEQTQINLNGLSIKSSNCEKLLGIKIDNRLTFNEHVKTLCKKTSQKLNALSRIAGNMKFSQRKLIINSFIMSQFSYCPLVWMFHSRILNERINKLQERSLRILYKDYHSSFSELLCESKSLTIHQINLHKLAIELFKVTIGASPQIVTDLFKIKNQCYDLRSDNPFCSRNIRTVSFGSESLTFLAPKIWDIVPSHIKMSFSVKEFKKKIKTWIPENCPCRLCKTFIPNLGFL